MTILDTLLAPLGHPFFANAILAGTAIAAACGLVGYFLVLRAQVFTGDALSHVAFTGALAALAFAIGTSEVPQWEKRLAYLGIEIESRVTWERGGVSLYFRDPDNRSVELATPGIWPCY